MLGDFSREEMDITEYGIPYVKSISLIDKVRVVNAAGKTVKVVNVPAGQRSIRLNANELSSGLNVVNVEGESANTCKVIVR